MIKIECKCTHKVLLPDSFAGRQVRCPRCKRPFDVPGQPVEYQLPRAPKAAAAVAPVHKPVEPPPLPAGPEDELAAVAGDRSRGYRESWHRRVHFEKSKGSHHVMVAALALVFLGVVIAIIVVVAVNRPPPVPEVITVKDVKVLPGPGGTPSPNQRIGVFGTKKPPREDGPMNENESENKDNPGDTPPEKNANEEEGVTVAGQKFTGNGRPVGESIGTSSSFDEAANATTIKSVPYVLPLATRRLEMIVRCTHPGRDRAAGPAKVTLRLEGSFKGIISTPGGDEPQMNLVIDERVEPFTPTAQQPVDPPDSDGGPRQIPTWVEYTLDESTARALAGANKATLSLAGEEMEVTPAMKALFKALTR